MSRSTAVVADELYEDVRELSVAVMNRAVPAPELYGILGNLKFAGGYFLAEALGRLADGIERSVAEFDVYEVENVSPAVNAATAAAMLEGAARYAEKLAQLLEAAQVAINGQGHHGRRPETATA
ncbi:MAG: hypothetical protein FWD85_06715 [Microbacteriaceae bacterium]|nr:hypothetical protein [Microbacteriaceae bacterium]